MSRWFLIAALVRTRYGYDTHLDLWEIHLVPLCYCIASIMSRMMFAVFIISIAQKEFISLSM